jgi:glutathione peroxidase-family protein
MIASNVPAELSDEVMDSALQYLEKSFKDRGLILKDHPGLNRLFTDAAYQAEIIKKTQENYKISYQNILLESQN